MWPKPAPRASIAQALPVHPQAFPQLHIQSPLVPTDRSFGEHKQLAACKLNTLFFFFCLLCFCFFISWKLRDRLQFVQWFQIQQDGGGKKQARESGGGSLLVCTVCGLQGSGPERKRTQAPFIPLRESLRNWDRTVVLSHTAPLHAALTSNNRGAIFPQ